MIPLRYGWRDCSSQMTIPEMTMRNYCMTLGIRVIQVGMRERGTQRPPIRSPNWKCY